MNESADSDCYTMDNIIEQEVETYLFFKYISARYEGDFKKVSEKLTREQRIVVEQFIHKYLGFLTTFTEQRNTKFWYCVLDSVQILQGDEPGLIKVITRGLKVHEFEGITNEQLALTRCIHYLARFGTRTTLDAKRYYESNILGIKHWCTKTTQLRTYFMNAYKFSVGCMSD